MPTIDRHLTPDDLAATMREDVRRGLTASPKVLAPKYFYDGRGSALFEEITRLPEYYPTRAERTILEARAAEVADLTKARTLVELGSGSSEKTHLLLGALRDVGSLERYVPVDVSSDAIEWAMPGLVEAYPGVEVHGEPMWTLSTAAGVLVASEPHDDDPAWSEVPDDHVLVVDDDGLRLTPL